MMRESEKSERTYFSLGMRYGVDTCTILSTYIDQFQGTVHGPMVLLDFWSGGILHISCHYSD